MRRPLRAAGVWTLRAVLVLLFLAALDVTALAFPYAVFPHRQRFGEFTVCSTRPLPDGFERIIEDARARAAAMDHARPGGAHRVFICGDERFYKAFALMTRKSPNTMAIGLAVFRNMYLNEPRIARMAAANVHGIRHSSFEGSVAEVVAHEIAHGAAIRKLGLRGALALPLWKSEGYAEYQANLAATRADTSYDLAERVVQLLDDAVWVGRPFSRRLFEGHVLVEFLAEKRGMDLDAIADERVTESEVREEMLAWYAGRRQER